MFEGYYANDRSYVPNLDKPIYNDSTRDALNREEQRRQEAYDRYSKSAQAYDQARNERRAREEAYKFHQNLIMENEIRELGEKRDRERQREVDRRINRANHWLKRNAFAKLINLVNGKSKKFKNYQEKIQKAPNVTTKQMIVNNMEFDLKIPGEEGRSR